MSGYTCYENGGLIAIIKRQIPDYSTLKILAMIFAKTVDNIGEIV